MQLYHDIPKSSGVANAVKRVRQMVELEWTPLKIYPCSYVIPMPDEIPVKRIDGYFAPFRCQQGMVYSSVRIYDRFVGFNISLETFMTAMNNPNSVLYTRCQHGKGRNMSSFYGTVCSGLVSYAMEMPYLVPCSDWPAVEGISEVSTVDLDILELGDIVLNTERHIAIITDILRDADGHVYQICVSESTPPLCVTRPYTQQAFRRYWLDRGFRVYRYARIHNVTYTPSPYIHLEGDPDVDPPVFSTLMTDFGNKANYLQNSEPVELSIFEEGWDAVEVIKPDDSKERYSITNSRVIIPSDKAGFYRAYCVRGKECSHSVEWCVVNIDVHTDKDVYKPGEEICVSFRNVAQNDRLVAYAMKSSDDFNRGKGAIPSDAAAAGKMVIQPDQRMHKPGNYGVVIVGENKYGQYVSARAQFRVEE